MITIVMYHYVRELASSRYPEIKGLELSLFREQLAYIQRHYQVIAAKELMDAARDGRMDVLPDNSLLLTFDDGLADHYKHVFPLLQHLGLHGSFFPPAMPIQEEKVLDVHKVHFILATVENKEKLVGEIFDYLDRKRDEWPLKSNTHYYESLAKAWRYDCGQVMFIKRMLQTVLPLELRGEVANWLFKKYVSDDERAFAAELYMSRDQLRFMVEEGMNVGSHSYTHQRMSGLSREEQGVEIERSLAFLRTLGCDCANWIMSYPYGDTDESLVASVRARGCKAGLTTAVGIADVSDDPFLLPRLDTNELPKKADAAAGSWTTIMQQGRRA